MVGQATPRFHARELARFAQGVLVALDVPDDDAALVADALVDAQLRGVSSHGVTLLPRYVDFIRRGAFNPRPRITRPLDVGPTATIDGDLGLGQLVATAATDLAIEKALEYGVGTVVARRCGHAGALAYYAQRAAARGCIGLVISQGLPTMAPTGGASKLLGNNPVAYAFPTRRGFPLVLDMAVSAVAGLKVVLHEQNGWPLPDGWVLDAAGRPTNDPRGFTETAFTDGGGTLVPMGGHKGYGLALAHDILAGVLSGGRFGKWLGAPGFSTYAQALRIDRFLPLEDYLDRVDELIDQLRDSGLAPGSAGIFVPGEQAHAKKTAHLAEGAPLDQATLTGLEQLADEFRVPPLTAVGASSP